MSSESYPSAMGMLHALLRRTERWRPSAPGPCWAGLSTATSRPTLCEQRVQGPIVLTDSNALAFRRFHTTEKGFDNTSITFRLFGHGEVGAVLEHHRLGARNPLNERLDKRGGHLVVSARRDQHWKVQLSEATGHVPVLEVARDVPLWALHGRVDLFAHVRDRAHDVLGEGHASADPLRIVGHGRM